MQDTSSREFSRLLCCAKGVFILILKPFQGAEGHKKTPLSERKTHIKSEMTLDYMYLAIDTFLRSQGSFLFTLDI